MHLCYSNAKWHKMEWNVFCVFSATQKMEYTDTDPAVLLFYLLFVIFINPNKRLIQLDLARVESTSNE